ncbi:hypothetical protein [Alkalicoccobacillus plakortidis]|uniref:Uncharacterized protein n=1 Tax=Alkalicoccobacillus plakortidis TaxID=444060 RepID=A0ABT0XHZ1_9BACI|nr:hypothetical protein [Alkalicoccobacillus plakortidis]MCM2675504.1 hypothetical protein [Alkalicoccobacillus plakortidis]
MMFIEVVNESVLNELLIRKNIQRQWELIFDQLAECTRHTELGELLHVHLDEYSRGTEGSYDFYFTVLELREEGVIELYFQNYLVEHFPRN